MFEWLMLIVHVPIGIGRTKERYVYNACSTSFEAYKDLNFLTLPLKVASSLAKLSYLDHY